MALEKQCTSCATAEVNGGHCLGRENEGNEKCPSWKDAEKRNALHCALADIYRLLIDEYFNAKMAVPYGASLSSDMNFMRAADKTAIFEEVVELFGESMLAQVKDMALNSREYKKRRVAELSAPPKKGEQ